MLMTKKGAVRKKTLKYLCQLTGAVTVNGILAKHVKLSLLCDDAAAAVIASSVHGRLRFQFYHLLWLVRFGLPATFSCKQGNETFI